MVSATRGRRWVSAQCFHGERHQVEMVNPPQLQTEDAVQALLRYGRGRPPTASPERADPPVDPHGSWPATSGNPPVHPVSDLAADFHWKLRPSAPPGTRPTNTRKTQPACTGNLAGRLDRHQGRLVV